MKHGPSTRVVVAIDFGTSRSGFAYSFTVDRQVVGWTDWPGQSTAYPKTLTQLLYGPDHTVVGWGFPASQKLAELRREKRASEYWLLQGFKMALHEGEEDADAGPLVRRPDGEDVVPVLDLIGDYLRLLKAFAWDKLAAATAGQLKDDEVLWCLTVPAIWSDRDKELMRRAAVMAGLVGEGPEEAERLLLVLEPEAAAIHCQEKDRHLLSEGTRFMVVDCGGGTVDITSHELVSGAMREVAPGTGGALGSTKIDQVFLERYLEDKLTPEVLAVYREEEPIEYLEMLGDWERLKCRFDPDVNLAPSCLVYRPRLFRLLDGRFPEVYDRLAAAGHEDGVYIQGGEMAAVFEPILDQILIKVHEELDRMGERGCDVLYLVGGFSASPLLQKRVRQELGEKLRIVVPPVPGAAVVEGAVSFGLDPQLIRSRRSRLTYGCATDLPFDPKKDPIERRIWSADREQWFCRDRFVPFVKAGETVDVDHKVTDVFQPMEKDQTEIAFDFYASRSAKVRYVDQRGVSRVGGFRVEMPDTSGGLDREVEVSMYFGKTEIEVKAVDRTSGKDCRITLSFAPTFQGDAS